MTQTIRAARPIAGSVMLLGLVLGCGSGSSDTLAPHLVRQAQRLVLAEEPAGAQGIVDVRATLTDQQPVILIGRIGNPAGPTWDPDQAAFIMVDPAWADHDRDHHGHDHHAHGDHAHEDHAHEHAAAHGPTHPTTLEDVTGLAADGHNHAHPPAAGASHVAHDEAGHDHQNCPFCQAAHTTKLEATALVQLVGADGQPIAADARKLLGLRDQQLVVVRGQAHINTLGQLVVLADGIYLRQ